MKIALAGNPNAGKTTLFNALTGANQYVGNWPGVTVEKKEGELNNHPDVVVQDLPGVYSLSPYSIEEKVTRSFLVEEKPDAILNIVDGSNLERNLYLSTQLAELGIPMLIAVNMMDVVKKNGDRIDFSKIAKALRCEVVGISAQHSDGVVESAQLLVKSVSSNEKVAEVPHVFSGSVEHAIAHIEESIQGRVEKSAIRWYAIKVFERDREVIARLKLGVGDLKHIEEHIRDCEKELGDDAESIITSQRYAFIQNLVGRALIRGTARRGKATISDKIDRIVTHRFFALPIFVVALSVMWYLAISPGGPGTRLTDWMNDVALAKVGDFLTIALASFGASETLRSMLIDGAWGGVATVLSFVPLITIIFLFLAFLEDCGYMARVAFIMDRLFRKFGLSGKSFIPMLIGKGCSVPAIMASRTIENVRDQRMTIILASFIPCGAKTVIIAMFSTVFFREMWYVAPMMDVIGIAIVVLGGIALKKSRAFSGEIAPFIMELPAYHVPTFRAIVIHTWHRVKGYVLKAGMVIFPACVFLWFITHFDWSFKLITDSELDSSILRSLAGAIAGFFTPLGFGTWQGAAASVTAQMAKEQAIATLSVLAPGKDIFLLFSTFSDYPRMAALSFMIFNLFIPPCIVAVVTTFREMGALKWGMFAVMFQLFVGYFLSLSVYQFGILFVGADVSFWTAVAFFANVFVLRKIFFSPRAKGCDGQCKTCGGC